MGSSSIDESLLMRKSDILIADGNYEEAISCLDMILEEKPDAEEALSMKGLAYCLKGDYEKGIDLLEEALSIDPFSKKVLITFADAYLHASMPEKSLEILDMAISYYPDDDGFLMLKATIIGALNNRKLNSFFN
ncbi:tetratricopeptide repeat protein [Methanolobus bombayensis]|uniref:tetratricopeptide repeat protein n=1 Tax=Methanolobus bombayensis TaxID=38023 RepID=UPI001AE4066F|nr:tetratricopeptide repeat protein [Methanolobus bombayensis]MBP1908425.1 tetratricopeptide (TPR) repeat protein [Methanolobus bombayensis]